MHSRDVSLRSINTVMMMTKNSKEIQEIFLLLVSMKCVKKTVTIWIKYGQFYGNCMCSSYQVVYSS